MSNIRKEKTLVSQLDIGMFVCELDRPWLETPFLLEGLLIETNEQIATIANLCKFVYVDHTVSVGNHYINPSKQPIVINHEVSANINHNVSYANLPNSSASEIYLSKTKQTQSSHQKFSFFEVLKEIKASNQAVSLRRNHVSENISLKLSPTFDVKGNTPPTVHQNEAPSLASQIKMDFANFVSSLRYWGQRPNTSRLKSNTNKSEIDNATTQSGNNSNTNFDEALPVEEEIATIYPIYEQSQIATQEIFEAFAQDQKVDLRKIDEALNGMVESIERNPDALVWLAKLKQTDNYSYNHALNVSITLMALSSFMSLPKKLVKELGLAGLLQDIGKVKIPADLLHKEDKITDEEYKLLQKHVDYALELLEVTDNISGTVILTVSQHHERIDGSGYPYQLTDKQISLTGQMAGLVDTYCALTSSKAYARGVYNQVALEQIHKLRDVKFSGALIDQLVQFMGMYPVTSLVELNTGEVAVVIQQNNVRRLLPRVLVLLNADKSKNEYPAAINLINAPLTPSGEPYKIIRGLEANSYGLDISNYFG